MPTIPPAAHATVVGTAASTDVDPRRVTMPVTISCPICENDFTPTGRQKFCCDACRAAAYRRRRDAGRATVVVPRAQPRRPITVYECDTCCARAVGEQRCADCSTFMRRVGIGGACPCCDEPVAVAEILEQEVTATN